MSAEDLSGLQKDPRNARTRDDRAIDFLQQSLRDVGAARSIVIDENDLILAGNGTVSAAEGIGLSKLQIVEAEGDTIIAVRRRGLTDEQKIRLSLYDNRTAELAEWDTDVLKELSEEVDLSGFFEPEEWSGLMDSLGEEEEPVEENEEEVVDLVDQAESGEIESRVTLGQVWKLGRHYIACADSTSGENIRKLMAIAKVGAIDMVWSDPPYGMKLNCDFSGAVSSLQMIKDKGCKGGNKYENVIGDHEDFDPTPILEFCQKTKESFWWGADYYAERIPDRNDGSFLVWDKRLDESADKMYGSGFELCWSKTRHKRDVVRIKWAGIFGMEKEFDKKRVHPTQKPTALATYFFERFGNVNDKIFDPFLGSGVSIIAAQQMEGDRVVVGFELSEAYCEIILQRFFNLTGIDPVLVGRLD